MAPFIPKSTPKLRSALHIRYKICFANPKLNPSKIRGFHTILTTLTVCVVTIYWCHIIRYNQYLWYYWNYKNERFVECLKVSFKTRIILR